MSLPSSNPHCGHVLELAPGPKLSLAFWLGVFRVRLPNVGVRLRDPNVGIGSKSITKIRKNLNLEVITVNVGTKKTNLAELAVDVIVER